MTPTQKKELRGARAGFSVQEDLDQLEEREEREDRNRQALQPSETKQKRGKSKKKLAAQDLES